jgi:hypothetical protein
MEGNAMPEFIPRTLVILTALIAAVALFIGVRDYLGTKHQAMSTTGAGMPTVVQPDTIVHKKVAITTKRRRQGSAAKENGPVPRSAQSDTDEPLIRDVLAQGEANHKHGRDVNVQPALKEAASRSASPSCAPLPNSTKPRDVDAIYYQGWAREYGCGSD